MVFILLSFVLSLSAKDLPVTEIKSSHVSDIGERATTRPTERISSHSFDEALPISEVLNGVGGIQSRTQGGPLISIRGSQSNSRALIIQDGASLNFLDGVGFNPLLIPRENLGDAVLLRGPSSPLLGRDAFAGALELRTRSLDSPKVRGTLSSLGTQETFVGVPLDTENVFGQITNFHSHADGNFHYKIPRAQGSDHRKRNDTDLSRQTLLIHNKSERFQWRYNHILAREIGSTPGSLEYINPEAFNNWAQLSSLSLKTKISDLSIEALSSYKMTAQDYALTGTNKASAFQEELRFNKKMDFGSLQFFGGLDHETFQASYFPSPISAQAHDIGASAAVEISESMSAQPALRYSTEINTLVPSLGFTGLAQNKWMYFVNYSVGYHPANVTQKYAQISGYTGNPGLEPELSEEIDMGFEKTEEPHFFHFEAFSRQTKNLVQNIVVSPGIVQPQNVGDARAYGFDTRGETVLHGIKLFGSISYLENRQFRDTPVVLSPQWQFRAEVSKQLQKLTLTLRDTHWTRYFDRSLTSGSLVELSGWNVLDFIAKFQFSEKMSGKFSVLNIFDQSRELSIGYPEPQRSFLISYETWL